MTMQQPGATEVEEWLNAVRKERAALESRLKPLLDQRRRLEEQEFLLTELLAVVDGKGRSPRESSGPASLGSSLPAGSSIKDQVVTRVAEILEEAGQPLHINEIYERYRGRGWSIPGAGRPVNITTHIRESDLIVSPKRGIYALASQVPGVHRRPAVSKQSKRKKGDRR
ncbi:MAG: hypothetical protein J5I28_05110 [Acidimicrobiales bacterium]|nr:hypothetical protein [Acidimicrobiales bacterium]